MLKGHVFFVMTIYIYICIYIYMLVYECKSIASLPIKPALRYYDEQGLLIHENSFSENLKYGWHL